MTDWLGTGARSARDVAEKIITEAIRRMKLAIANDPATFPPLSDVSTVLANRVFTHTPMSGGSTISSGDLNTVLAAQMFGRRPDPRITAPYLGATELSGRLHLVPGSGQIVIDTSALAAGTYLLDIGGASGADRSLTRIGVPGAAVGLTATYRTATTNIDWLFTNTKSFTIDAGGITVTGNSVITGTLNVTGAVTAPSFIGALTGNASTATNLSHANQTVAGAGSSAALHDLISKLNNLGANLTDTTTP